MWKQWTWTKTLQCLENISKTYMADLKLHFINTCDCCHYCLGKKTGAEWLKDLFCDELLEFASLDHIGDFYYDKDSTPLLLYEASFFTVL